MYFTVPSSNEIKSSGNSFENRINKNLDLKEFDKFHPSRTVIQLSKWMFIVLLCFVTLTLFTLIFINNRIITNVLLFVSIILNSVSLLIIIVLFTIIFNIIDSFSTINNSIIGSVIPLLVSSLLCLIVSFIITFSHNVNSLTIRM